MCRIYLCISLGMLQPLFLLTAMLLCQQSIRYARHRSFADDAHADLPMLLLIMDDSGSRYQRSGLATVRTLCYTRAAMK